MDTLLTRACAVAATLLLLAAGGCQVREPASSTAGGEPGTVTPHGPGDAGTALAGLPAGKVVLLDVWAPWDAPSRAGQQDLDALAAELAPRGVAVVGWAVSDGSKPADWPAVHYERRAVTREQLAALGAIRALPTRLLVDRRGKVRHTYPGASLPAQWRADLAVLLTEP